MNARELALILLRTPMAEVTLLDGTTNNEFPVKGIVTNGRELTIHPNVNMETMTQRVFRVSKRMAVYMRKNFTPF